MSHAAGATDDRAAIEEQMARIWAEVLRRESVDPEVHFDQLGGTSLSGLRLIARIRKELGVRLPLEAFLDYPTVTSMADYVATVRSGGP